VGSEGVAQAVGMDHLWNAGLLGGFLDGILEDAYVMMIDRILSGYRPADYAKLFET
jgi:hypothetical protein